MSICSTLVFLPLFSCNVCKETSIEQLNNSTIENLHRAVLNLYISLLFSSIKVWKNKSDISKNI